MANTCVVMFNEADLCDSLAFVGWGCFKTYVRDKIASDEDWDNYAGKMYDDYLEATINNPIVNTVYGFSEWIEDMPISDMLAICAYFGYSAVEEIEFPNW